MAFLVLRLSRVLHGVARVSNGRGEENGGERGSVRVQSSDLRRENQNIRRVNESVDVPRRGGGDRESRR